MDKTVVEDSSSWIADNGTSSATVSESLLCEVLVDCVDDVVVIIVVCLSLESDLVLFDMSTYCKSTIDEVVVFLTV
jgi:hypothetical protein